MKYNLKNRPKPKFDLGSPYCGGWLRTYTEWFKGFQKELREKEQISRKFKTSVCQEIKADFIKEILGE